MNTINRDIIMNIMEFVPEYNIEGFYQLDSEWRHAMHYICRKKSIYKHYDLGRDYSQVFVPFSQVIFGEVDTEEKREDMFEQLSTWFSSFVKRDTSGELEKYKKELVKRNLLDVNRRNMIDEKWDNFFKSIRSYLSHLPIIRFILKPELQHIGPTNETENSYKDTKVLKDNMNKTWYAVLGDSDEIESYEFNTYIWCWYESVLAFMEKRTPRQTPYSNFDSVRIEDFDSSLLEEGIWTQPIPIHNQMWVEDDEEDEEDEEDEDH